MAKKPVHYSVIDAFTETAFKGNPAAVCLLEEGRDEGWMQSVAAEFNISDTAFLTRISSGISDSDDLDPSPRFGLRWFTPVAEIDAFTDTAFKGNPAAVCLLEEERDEGWMQSVAAEFNVSDTAFLSRIGSGISDLDDLDLSPRFSLRWFTPVAEVELCGHATIASAHFLFTSGLVRTDRIEFITKSGLLTAEKVYVLKQLASSLPTNDKAGEHFSIELNFPTIPVLDCDPTEIPSIPRTLNGASVFNIKKAANGDLIVELLSGEVVAGLQPQFDELKKCSGAGVIITGPASPGSGFDFFTRYFCPKLGVNEDPVCGSVHCALAPYWSKKLGKHDLIAYMASPRGGRLDLHLEEETQRVLIRGEAVTVMTGTLVV